MPQLTCKKKETFRSPLTNKKPHPPAHSYIHVLLADLPSMATHYYSAIMTMHLCWGDYRNIVITKPSSLTSCRSEPKPRASRPPAIKIDSNKKTKSAINCIPSTTETKGTSLLLLFKPKSWSNTKSLPCMSWRSFGTKSKKQKLELAR